MFKKLSFCLLFRSYAAISTLAMKTLDTRKMETKISYTIT